MATHTNEDIIEKRDTSPVATSCIVFATLALLGAIALQVAEIREIRADYGPSERNKGVVLRTESDYNDLENRIDDVLRDTKIADSDRESKTVESKIAPGEQIESGKLADKAREFEDDDDDMAGGDDDDAAGDDDDAAGDDDDDDFGGGDDDDDFGDDDDDFGDDDDDDFGDDDDDF